MPAEAADPCAIFLILGLADPTQLDLERGYNVRGEQLVECDGKRRLAVETHAKEHADEDAWLAEMAKRRKPRWKVW